MKVEIPEQLKSDVPQTTWGKILTATPVVMAVVATMLAGLASSEMNRAQYSRSLAAQQQSKAGDQWSFFQAKRLRGAVQLNSLELLRNLTVVSPFTGESLKSGIARLDPSAAEVKSRVTEWLSSPGAAPAVSALAKGQAPQPEAIAALDPGVQALKNAVERDAPESEMAPLLTQVKPRTIELALGRARDQTQAYDQATGPINDAISRLDKILASLPAVNPAAAGGGSLQRDFSAARLQYAANRYENEARLNQAIANLYELQVRQSNFTAARHHTRSQRFFFGMLGAQLGVIISTFAIAARKRNLLWAMAAGAGLIAVAFAIYVYLYV